MNETRIVGAADLEFVSQIFGDENSLESLNWLADKGFIQWTPTGELLLTMPTKERTDRNAPCPCGSPKKYKLCHGKRR